MGWIVILGLCLFAAGFLIWGIKLFDDTSDTNGLGWVGLVLVAFGAMFTTGAIIDNQSTVNRIHQASYRQGIQVSTDGWQQAPHSTMPCRIDLDYNEETGLLYISGTNKPASLDQVTQLCAK